MNNQPTQKKSIAIPDVISVKDFADKSGIPVTKIITELMRSGILATINQTIDFDTALLIADEFNIEVTKEEAKGSEQKTVITYDQKDLKERPPVVTIMGHVDHGKTSLLDRIRSAHVASGESGGITQHITAYQISLDETRNKNLRNRTITFIDTPGHAAFSAVRGHGAAITDIVVLIVAANDGVMPQTIEVINQAKSYNVPIIVAINKVDLPDADVMKVKQQLTEYDLVSEEWGGKTMVIEVSAKSGTNVDELLESILLQADMMELKANPNEKAVGVVIEARMSRGTGATAVILVENGTLKKGDPIAIGSSYGKIRILENHKGEQIDTAAPSTPVRIAGFKTLPDFGDRLIVLSSEKEARETALKAQKSTVHLSIATAKKTSEDQKESILAELNVVIKCDVLGSVEAVRKSLKEIETDEAKIKIISEGAGAISESDVTLARATNAVVFGFRAKPLGAAKKIAEKEGIKIKTYEIIYEMIDAVKNELVNLLPPLIIEEETATGEVLAIFRDDKKGFVAGGRIMSGKMSVNDEVKFIQDKTEKYRDKVQSIRKGKSEAKDVESGSECGFGLTIGAKVAVGDKFISFHTIEKKRTL